MKIAYLGDVALFGQNSYENIDLGKFDQLLPKLRECDYVVANLEMPLTRSEKTVKGKSACLRGYPEDVKTLKHLGVTHVSLANNHVFDHCKEGFDDTISALDGAGIEYFGVNGRTCLVEGDGSSVILRGSCCMSTNPKGQRYLDIFDPEEIEKELREDRANGFITSLSVHWGEEHVHYPNPDHVETARILANENRCIISGNHPHVIQGIEKCGDSIVSYSQGNFCFDDVYTPKSSEPLIKLSHDNMESFILIVSVENGSISGTETVPFSFESGSYEIRDEINDSIKGWSSELGCVDEAYAEKRKKILSSYLSGRKAKRNLEWYLKRMNFESFIILYDLYSNRKKYDKYVKSFIESRKG